MHTDGHDRVSVVIREESPADAAAVRDVNERAFGTPLEAGIVDALRGSDGSISLVATSGDLVVGHILFTPVTIDAGAGVRVAGLAPMAVLPEHQRAGIGSRLVKAGLDACRRRGYAAVVVLGHPEYYPRFGFTRADGHGLSCEFPVPPEAFMVMGLQPEVLTRLSGTVRYRPEFAEG
jgi:putative acetyltransferase